MLPLPRVVCSGRVLLHCVLQPPVGNRLLLPSPAIKQESKGPEENIGLIVYNGAMVDVGSLLQKLEKSEKARAEMEQKLQSLEEKTGGMA